MGLLCAASLQQGRAPPRTCVDPQAPGRSASALLPYLQGGERARHWQQEFDELAPGERDAVSGLLLSIALRRFVRRREFGRVRDLLALGSRLGLTNRPAASQAAEMLGRLAVAAPQLGRG